MNQNETPSETFMIGNIPEGIKVSETPNAVAVGENGIRAGFEYKLNEQGEFVEVGKFKTPNPFVESNE